MQNLFKPSQVNYLKSIYREMEKDILKELGLDGEDGEEEDESSSESLNNEDNEEELEIKINKNFPSGKKFL